MQSLVLSTTVVNIYSGMSFPSWSVWQTYAKVILVALFVWPLSHTISALFNAKTFTLPLFSSVWPTGEELIFIPSIRKKILTLYSPILFYTKTFICVAATLSFQFNWCFCCRNSNLKRGFYSSALLCCKKKIENAGFAVLCVILLQKKLVLKLKWGPP